MAAQNSGGLQEQYAVSGSVYAVRVYSVGYPLLVNNWTRRAMNEAAELGADAVDADVVNAL